MKTTLQTLLSQAQSTDPQQQHNAIFYIALLLEKHTTFSADQGFYETELPASFCALHLDIPAQRLLITTLSAILLAGHAASSILWALGKTTLPEALAALLRWLQSIDDRTDEPTLWQALVSLDRFLVVQDDGQFAPSVAHSLQAYRPVPLLQRLVATGSPRLQEMAHTMLQRLAHGLSTPQADSTLSAAPPAEACLRHLATGVPTLPVDDPARLPERLEHLTVAGKTVWLRKAIEPTVVYCFTETDLLLFEYQDVTPDTDACIVLRVRNLSYLWLPLVPGFTTLKQLIEDAREDPDELSRRLSALQEKVLMD